MNQSQYRLLDRAAATVTGSARRYVLSQPIAVQASIEGTSGTVTASVTLYGSNDEDNVGAPDNAAAVGLKTFSLSGTGVGAGLSAASDVYALDTQYRFVWAKLTAISGTGATVSVWLGV